MNVNKNKTANSELQATADGLKEAYGQTGTAAGFKIGQPRGVRYGGRKPGSLNKRTRQAIEICESMDFHPAALLATVALTGKLPNPDGTTTEIDASGRLDALKALCPYVMPRLQATTTQLTGKDDGPLAVAGFDMAKLLSDPDAVEAAQRLAIMMAKPDDPETLPARIYTPGDWQPEK